MKKYKMTEIEKYLNKKGFYWRGGGKKSWMQYETVCSIIITVWFFEKGYMRITTGMCDARKQTVYKGEVPKKELINPLMKLLGLNDIQLY